MNFKRRTLNVVFIVITLLFSTPKALGQGLIWENVKYLGGFTLPHVPNDPISNFSYAAGAFAISEDGNSVFIVGHTRDQAIAELNIPEFTGRSNIKDMKRASFKQGFSKLFTKVRDRNSQKINRITGMKIIEGQLFVNAMTYYDGGSDNTHTTLILRTPDDLEASKVAGFFETRGAAHTTGWISPVPKQYQMALKSEYLVGNASNFPITSRSSVGPSLFTFNPFGVLDKSINSGMIITETVLDFSLKHPMHADLYNEKKSNDIWTITSKAFVGFISQTEEYIVVGTSAGHKRGLGYKIKQLNGRLCGGPCPLDPKDEYNYFWIWEMDRLIKPDDAMTSSHNIQPSRYGNLILPHLNGLVIGGYFDSARNRLYLLESNADRKSKYVILPVMRIYQLPPLQSAK
ncbi:hypothetical protein WNY77_11775 [Paraglaciecola mesophila]|uniref:DUF4185 domain-containing protein n=1 Tax=Paraglaciecola mesophila TaxID=197222 RepID=A0ABU9SW08_9ALTE